MDFAQFISEGNIYIIAVIYAIGMFIKASAIKDKLIPFILLALGIVFSMLLNGFNVDSVMQGILCSASAVFVNQLVKQAKE